MGRGFSIEGEDDFDSGYIKKLPYDD